MNSILTILIITQIVVTITITIIVITILSMDLAEDRCAPAQSQ